MKIPVDYFPTILGSMTSPDGQTFMLRVKRQDGADLMLGFPHREIPNIVECCAMQMANGKDEEGQAVVSAFHTSSFRLGMGERGEMVLTLIVGESGVISFILPADLEGQLFDALGRSMVRH
jgi:hypothetical protein